MRFSSQSKKFEKYYVNLTYPSDIFHVYFRK